MCARSRQGLAQADLECLAVQHQASAGHQQFQPACNLGPGAPARRKRGRPKGKARAKQRPDGQKRRRRGSTGTGGGGGQRAFISMTYAGQALAPVGHRGLPAKVTEGQVRHLQVCLQFSPSILGFWLAIPECRCLAGVLQIPQHQRRWAAEMYQESEFPK